MQDTQPKTIEKLVSFEDGDDKDSLVVKQSQFIPDEFLSRLRMDRSNSISTPAGEFHRAAVIPTILVDKWKREGFDIHREPIHEILKRLRKEQLDAFIATNKVL